MYSPYSSSALTTPPPSAPPPSPAFDYDPISPIRYIETNVIKSDPPSNVGDDPKPGVGGSLKLTGQMGDVMKESASIAMTVGRKKLTDYMSNNEVRERKGEKEGFFHRFLPCSFT